jgi:hypothetical protein
MAPMLVASNDTRGIVLVVQVPGAVSIDEHTIGIVHEILRMKMLAKQVVSSQASMST